MGIQWIGIDKEVGNLSEKDWHVCTGLEQKSMRLVFILSREVNYKTPIEFQKVLAL